ncbi:hypothetical protein AMECASPLE_022550, partial [Ameca splendens]
PAETGEFLSKRIRVSTLADITKVVENSSRESRLNIPQLIYQHFSFDANRPGVVQARNHSDQSLLAFSCCVTRKFYPLSPLFLPCVHLDWPWTDRLIFIQRSGLSVLMK